LPQVLPVQEESVGASDGASRESAGRQREERQGQARVHLLPGEVRVQAIAEDAHEEPARICGRGPAEAPVRPVRRGAVLHETLDGAQAWPRWREDLQVRRVRQGVRQQGEPQRPQAHAHGREAARVSAVRQELHTETFAGPAPAISFGTETVSVSGLRQRFRVQHAAEEAPQGAREGRVAEDVRAAVPKIAPLTVTL